MNSNRNHLSPKCLNGAQVTLTDRVRVALSRDDLRLSETEFAALQAEIRERLANIYPQASRNFTAVLMAGSGATAVEAMIGSLVPKGGEALVVANGSYGERMAAILRAQGNIAHVASAELTEPLNLEAAGRILAENRGVTHVVAAHYETTTGRLNDLPTLGAICRRYGVALLLDGVSSFGAEEIDFEGWNLEACAGAVDKCLHGAPGLSFVLARKRVIESGAIDFRHYAEQSNGSTPSTISANVCYALAEALRELEASGGWRARRQRYTSLSRRVFEGLREQGVRPLLDITQPLSSVVTAYRVPAGYDCARLLDFLKSAGFVICVGQDEFDQEVFRIAVMGAIDSVDVARLLACFRQFWSRNTGKIQPARVTAIERASIC
ncbi:MAG: aminotransferase class V-fold PLP-dependent enzyme [Blastocatellales bacterium]